MHRQKDTRAVVILCSLCHDLHCGLEFKSYSGTLLPCISNAEMIWLKKVMDPERFDQAYINRVWLGRPPEPLELKWYWESQYRMRRGERAEKGKTDGY